MSKPGQYGETNEKVGKRDAFHVPAILVNTEHNINPGSDVKFVDDALTVVEPCCKAERQAIADPWIDQIGPDDSFWVFLLPNTVANLTHSFDISVEKKKVGVKVVEGDSLKIPVKEDKLEKQEEDDDTDEDDEDEEDSSGEIYDDYDDGCRNC